jgi:hypothetical protein
MRDITDIEAEMLEVENLARDWMEYYTRRMRWLEKERQEILFGISSQLSKPREPSVDLVLKDRVRKAHTTCTCYFEHGVQIKDNCRKHGWKRRTLEVKHEEQ